MSKKVLIVEDDNDLVKLLKYNLEKEGFRVNYATDGTIALAEAHGSTVTLDGDFGRDLEEIINSHREPLNPPAWD